MEGFEVHARGNRLCGGLLGSAGSFRFLVAFVRVSGRVQVEEKGR